MKAEIFKALFHVQQKLKVPKTEKNEKYDYKYRTCESILKAAKSVLAEVNALVYLTDRIVEIGGANYIEAVAHFCVEGIEEELQIPALAKEVKNPASNRMNESQSTGSSSSYARKYALNALFCIDDGRDPDSMEKQDKQSQDNRRNSNQQQNNSNKRKNNQQRNNNSQQNNKPNVFSEEELQTMRNAYETHKDVYERICKEFNVKSPKNIVKRDIGQLFYDALVGEVIKADKGGQ